MRKKARLLLVDSNEIDFVITRRMLGESESSEFQIDWAPTYDEALRMLEAARHDLCLIEYEIGDRTCFDLLREAAQRGRDLPFVLLTANDDQDLDRRAQTLGAAAFLDKTRVCAADLERTVRAAIQNHALVNQLLEHNEELLRLHRMTDLALGAGALQDVCDQAAVEIAEASGFPYVAVDLPRVRDSAPGWCGAMGCHPASLRPVRSTGAWEGSAEVIRLGRPRIEMGLSGEGPAHPFLGRRVRTVACVPITVEGKTCGALTLAHHDGVVVDSDQLQQASTLANHFGHVIRRVHQPRTEPGTAQARPRTTTSLKRVSEEGVSAPALPPPAGSRTSAAAGFGAVFRSAVDLCRARARQRGVTVGLRMEGLPDEPWGASSSCNVALLDSLVGEWVELSAGGELDLEVSVHGVGKEAELTLTARGSRGSGSGAADLRRLNRVAGRLEACVVESGPPAEPGSWWCRLRLERAPAAEV